MVALYWPVAAVLAACAQGLLLPTFRNRVPPDTREARQISFSLHTLLLLAYLLPVLLAPATWWVALLSRAVLFDAGANLASGERLFYVGKTAFLDRALNWLALRLHLPPDRLRALASVAVLLLAAGWHWLRY